jgi:D,D-heptose 1,7-bisphosphate phosphatase
MQGNAKGQGAVFFDRDGTINVEVGYLDSPERLVMIPGAADAIRFINASGLKTVVVTNQSGVARGFFDEAMVLKIHERIQEFMKERGAWIDRFYYCPHHPTHGQGHYLRDCNCRKPAPGMLLKAAEELSLSLEDSFIVGDTLNDIEAGARVGVRGVLVQTGYGGESAAMLSAAADCGGRVFLPAYVAATLSDAVGWIMKERAAKT